MRDIVERSRVMSVRAAGAKPRRVQVIPILFVAAIAATGCLGPDARDDAGDAGSTARSDAGRGDDAGHPPVARDGGIERDSGSPAGAPIYVIGTNPSGFGRSEDASAWSDLQPTVVVEGDNAVSGLCIGNGVAVGVGDAGVHTSTDGRTWTRTVSDRHHSSVCTFGLGMFVVVSGSQVLTSVDGFTWTTTNDTGYARHWFDVEFGEIAGVPTFIAVGDENEAPKQRIKRSTDGIHWDYIVGDPESGVWIQHLAIGHGVAVGVTNLATRAYVYDGSNWEDWREVEYDATARMPDIAFGDGRFLMVDTTAVLTSTDGYAWVRQVPTGAPPVQGTCLFDGARWIGLNPQGGTVTASDDGLAWAVTWAPSSDERGQRSPYHIVHGYVGE